MTKPIHIVGVAALALSLAALSAPAAAEDRLRERVVASLADAVAAQGNAALVQIRAEIRERLAETLKPYLPTRGPVVPEPDTAPNPNS